MPDYLVILKIIRSAGAYSGAGRGRLVFSSTEGTIRAAGLFDRDLSESSVSGVAMLRRPRLVTLSPRSFRPFGTLFEGISRPDDVPVYPDPALPCRKWLGNGLGVRSLACQELLPAEKNRSWNRCRWETNVRRQA